MRRSLVILIALAAAGCGPYTHAEMNLAAQARRGIALVGKHDDARDRAVAELARLKRQRLDQAFDADVQLRATQETLDPEWVIEARRAYAVALDAYANAKASDERAAEARKRNLAATDAALQRLQWMQSLRMKFDPFAPAAAAGDKETQP